MIYHRGVLPPSFLALPARPPKPRTTGLTHVLDIGVPPVILAAVLDSGAEFIDIWKIGWGIAYVDRTLPDKLRLLAEHGVPACLGGTLLEIAWARDKTAECLDWAAEVGFDHVEVSRGTVAMTLPEKHALIRLAATRFVVLAEVGSKDPDQEPPVAQWASEADADLAAGASLVVTEGRQSGTVGTFDSTGRVRGDVVASVVGAVGQDRVLFEAPRTDQQAWFIQRFGPEVNLGNVAPEDVLGVQTLRLGLRADTSHLAGPEPVTEPKLVC